MKKIRIERIIEPIPNPVFVKDQYYWVFLGNSTKHQFGSKRDAISFLGVTNKFLNAKLHEANYLLMEVFSHYRENWFYFWHNKKTYSNKLYHSQLDIERGLDGIKSAFDMLVQRSNSLNGNYLVWHHFNTIFNLLTKICGVIEELQRARSNGAEAERIRILMDRITICRNQINYYGQKVELTSQVNELGRIVQLPVNLVSGEDYSSGSTTA